MLRRRAFARWPDLRAAAAGLALTVAALGLWSTTSALAQTPANCKCQQGYQPLNSPPFPPKLCRKQTPPFDIVPATCGGKPAYKLDLPLKDQLSKLQSDLQNLNNERTALKQARDTIAAMGGDPSSAQSYAYDLALTQVQQDVAQLKQSLATQRSNPEIVVLPDASSRRTAVACNAKVVLNRLFDLPANQALILSGSLIWSETTLTAGTTPELAGLGVL